MTAILINVLSILWVGVSVRMNDTQVKISCVYRGVEGCFSLTFCRDKTYEILE